MARTIPTVLCLLITLPLAGCVSPTEGAGTVPEGPGTHAFPGQGGLDGVAADRGERGGPAETGDGLSIGAVRTVATDNDTVELFTGTEMAEPAGDTGAVAIDWTARLSISFTAAQRSGDDVVFHGTAGYLHDQGAYVLHSQDFTVLVPDSGGEEGSGFAAYTAEDAEPLAELTPEEPNAQFSVTISEVPKEADSERLEDGMTGRYIRYETPEVLWGHEVEPPADHVPGLLCYIEGDSWHGVELFERADLPCG